jgi:hypothetical protein
MALIVASILGFATSDSSWAFDCYYTLAKNDCWTSYSVTVDVIDAETATVLTKVTVPPGTSWVRQAFNCTPGQALTYKATFSPIIWESDKNKIYTPKRFAILPKTIKSGATAWDVAVCFPADFSGVPFPPKAIGNCKCDFDSIPKIAPK